MTGVSYEQMLRRCLFWAEEHPERAEGLAWPTHFASMLERFETGRAPSEGQRAYVGDVYEGVADEPTYQNLWSSGKVPRGLREVPTPAVLQNLPLKPPGRR